MAKYYNSTYRTIYNIINNKSYYDINYKPKKNRKERQSKFDIDTVNKIREYYNTNQYTIKQLAHNYNVTSGWINSLINNITYIDKNYKRVRKDPIHTQKLTNEETNKIRSLFKEYNGVKNKFCDEIANKYNISPTYVFKIINNKCRLN